MPSPLVPFTARDPDGSPVLLDEEEEEISHKQPSVSLVVGEDGEEGVGTLFITTRRLVWLSDAQQDKGYAVGFPQITMHAVSRDNGPPCIYTQLEGAEGMSVGEDDEMTEMRLVPSDPGCLEAVFQVLCDCAAMNPDPDGEDDEGGFFYDEDEVAEGAGGSERAAMLDRFDEMLQIGANAELHDLMADDPSRFDDADEDLDDETGMGSNGNMGNGN